jgi:hypothetical protein
MELEVLCMFIVSMCNHNSKTGTKYSVHAWTKFVVKLIVFCIGIFALRSFGRIFEYRAVYADVICF